MIAERTKDSDAIIIPGTFVVRHKNKEAIIAPILYHGDHRIP